MEGPEGSGEHSFSKVEILAREVEENAGELVSVAHNKIRTLLGAVPEAGSDKNEACVDSDNAVGRISESLNRTRVLIAGVRCEMERL